MFACRTSAFDNGVQEVQVEKDVTREDCRWYAGHCIVICQRVMMMTALVLRGVPQQGDVGMWGKRVQRFLHFHVPAP